VKSNPPPDTASLALSWSQHDFAEVEAVTSTLPSVLACPYCGGRRRPNGRRVIRYRDAPLEGVPRLVDWHRQHYRCVACGRASNEENPAFEKDRFITSRFAEWVKEKSVSANLSAIAKEAGMNKVVLRRLFHSLTTDQPKGEARSPAALGIALVNLAGSPRPVLADVERHFIVDIFASLDELKAALERGSASGLFDATLVVRDIELNLPGLLRADDVRRLWPRLKQSVISSHSLARVAVRMMIELCEPWFKQTAEDEQKSPISVRKLFARRKDKLKRSGSSRVNGWAHRKESQFLSEAYGLKERFNQIWRDGDGLPGWQDWKDDAKKLPKQRFQGIVDLVETNWSELVPCFVEVQITMYERWLDELQAYEIRGTHSFAAAKQALLAKYGEPRKETLPSSEEPLDNDTFEWTLAEEDDAALARLSEIEKLDDDER
jgi:DNA-directed RNA polymerase subunit RPC12/RpoP